jgi:hypothetical protein
MPGANLNNPAHRAYLIRFGISMTSYVVALFAVQYTFRHYAPDGALRYVLGVIPAIPLLGVIYAVGRYLVEEPDEFIRFQTVGALLRALGVTLSLATVWGFVESFAGAPHIPLYYVSIVFCAAFGLARLWLNVGLP